VKAWHVLLLHVQASGDKLTQGELLMRQALQSKTEEVMSLQMQVQELRRRERVLMDRWVGGRLRWEGLWDGEGRVSRFNESVCTDELQVVALMKGRAGGLP